MDPATWQALVVGLLGVFGGVLLGMRISAYRWLRYMEDVRRRLPREVQLVWLQAEDAERRNASRVGTQ